MATVSTATAPMSRRRVAAASVLELWYIALPIGRILLGRTATPDSSEAGVHRRVRTHPGLVEGIDLVVAEAAERREDLTGVLAEQRGVPHQRGVALHEPPRDARLLEAGHPRMGQVHPEVAPQQLRVVVDVAGVEHAAGGHARFLQDLHGVLRIAIAGPVADHGVELVVAGP